MLTAPRREFERVDLAAERGLPLSLVAAIEAEGGLPGQGIASLEPLREHPKLRMLALGAVQAGAVLPLETIPNLVAVGRGSRLAGEPPYPDLAALPRDDPLREEFRHAVSG